MNYFSIILSLYTSDILIVCKHYKMTNISYYFFSLTNKTFKNNDLHLNFNTSDNTKFLSFALASPTSNPQSEYSAVIRQEFL